MPSLVDSSHAFSEWINSDAVRTGVTTLLDNLKGVVSVLAQVPGELTEIDNEFRKWNGKLGESNSSLGELLDKLKSFTNFKPGAPLTISWSAPDWLKAINTPTAGSGLDARMTKELTTPIFALGNSLKLIVPDIETTSNGLGGLVEHIDATSGAAKKAPAPIVAMADAAQKARDASTAFIEQLQKEVATYGKSQIETKRYEAGLKDLTPAQRELAKTLIDTLAEWEQYSKVVKASYDAVEKLTAGNADLEKQVAEGRDKVAGLSDAQVKYNAALRDANKLAKDALVLGPPTAAVQREIENRLKMIATIRDQANDEAAASKADDIVNQLDEQNNPYKKQLDAIKALQVEIDKFNEKSNGAFDADKLKKYTEAQEQLNRQIAGAKLEDAANAVSAGLTSLQGLAKEGTKAYAEMQVAIDAANIAAAIGAIVNQGMGDPYTAFARIAAMAALMATFVHDIGSAGAAGFHDVAASRQESQGTGTVLGDSKAKSESIAKATEITANATTQLVGLNRGMLTALQALQSALGAAGVQLARGAGQVPTPTLSGPDGLQMTPIGSALESFFLGGSQKVVDQGIVIAGGALSDMLNSIVVGAYQTIETNGGLFGSNSIKEAVTPVAAEFAKQFQLVIGSIVDTVRAGATAIGLLPADIEKAIAEYKVAEIKISLKGLSAEDQEKAIEAVFSSIFDGLAGAVVPFIGQFQKVGEGLGETLVRVATEVQVTQEAFKQLGLSVSTVDPETYAQIADGLVEAAGGLDAFITGMQSFVKNFSDSAHQFMVDSDALNSAFGQVGLKLPDTRDGMWELMQSLDASTESGRAAIATLLRLSDTANEYYNQLDQFKETLGLSGNSEFNKQLKAIQDSAIGLIKALQAAGASTQTLQRVYDASVNKINELIEQMRESARSLAFSLGLTNSGSLDQINSEIARLQGLAGDGAAAVSGFGNAMHDASQQAMDAIQLLLGDKSPFNDQRKLEIARQGLIAGTVSQDQFLEVARRLYASSQRYNTEFAFAQQFPGRGVSNSVQAGGGARPGLSPADQQRLADLLEEKKKLDAQEQLSQFRDLARQIADISSATGEDFRQVLEEMGVTDIDKLVKGLGLENEDALKTYIDNIKAQQEADGNGTKSIVDVLKQILVALGGTPTDETGSLNEPGGGKPGTTNRDLNTDRTANAPPIPGGRVAGDASGGGSRMFSDDDAEAFGRAVGRELSRGEYRSSRGVTA